MGRVKRLELWWQLYVTSLPERDVRNIRPLDLCWTECTKMATIIFLRQNLRSWSYRPLNYRHQTQVQEKFRTSSHVVKLLKYKKNFSQRFCTFCERHSYTTFQDSTVGTKNVALLSHDSSWCMLVLLMLDNQWTAWVSPVMLCCSLKFLRKSSDCSNRGNGRTNGWAGGHIPTIFML